MDGEPWSKVKKKKKGISIFPRGCVQDRGSLDEVQQQQNYTPRRLPSNAAAHFARVWRPELKVWRKT